MGNIFQKIKRNTFQSIYYRKFFSPDASLLSSLYSVVMDLIHSVNMSVIF